jgi:hypothetical protein
MCALHLPFAFTHKRLKFFFQ